MRLDDGQAVTNVDRPPSEMGKGNDIAHQSHDKVLYHSIVLVVLQFSFI